MSVKQYMKRIYTGLPETPSKTKWKKYKSELDSKLSKFIAPTDPDNYANKISSVIYESALSSLGYRKYIKTYKPWRNNQINSLQKATKRLKRKLEKLRAKYPDFYQHMPKYNRMNLEYKSTLNHKTQTIRIAKKIYLKKLTKHYKIRH